MRSIVLKVLVPVMLGVTTLHAQVTDEEIVESFVPPALVAEVQEIAVTEGRTPTLRSDFEQVDLNGDSTVDALVAVYSNGDSAIARLVATTQTPALIGEAALRFAGFLPAVQVLDIGSPQGVVFFVTMDSMGGGSSGDLLQWTGTVLRVIRPDDEESLSQFVIFVDVDDDGVLELFDSPESPVGGTDFFFGMPGKLYKLRGERFELESEVIHFDYFAGPGVYDRPFTVPRETDYYRFDVVNGPSYRLDNTERVDNGRTSDAYITYAPNFNHWGEESGVIADESEFVSEPASITKEMVVLNLHNKLHVENRGAEGSSIVVMVRAMESELSSAARQDR